MKFGNIIMDRIGRCTVGDDIQLLAIENLYKHMGIDYNDVIRIPFSELSTYSGEYVILPLSFPFYGFSNGNNITNFSSRIIPVFLGFATMLNHYNETDLKYLQKFQPIGCRDQYTMSALRQQGIEAYLNGCMTATLPRMRNGFDGRHKVFCVDIPDDFKKFIPKEILENCEFVNHVVFSKDCPQGTEVKAKEVYKRYVDEAKMVITTRMHAALPCIAMGIPVILAKDKYSVRFPIIERFIPVYTAEQFHQIDWEPKSVEYENIKLEILNCASRRLKDTYDKYADIYKISEFYETDSSSAMYLDNFSDTEAYLEKTLKKMDTFEYILWGVTQTAELAHSYIKSHYKNAKLVGVIDQFKDLEIYGMHSSKKEIIEKYPNSICLVCAGAAMPEAKKYFNDINYKNGIFCWSDGLPQ